MRLSPVTFFLLAAAVLVNLNTAPTAAPAPNKSILRIRLVLHEALPRGDKQEPAEPSVILGLQRTGQIWERVWATAGNYNRNEHTGRVDSAEISDSRMKIAITLALKPDPWVPGGRFHVEVELKMQADGRAPQVRLHVPQCDRP